MLGEDPKTPKTPLAAFGEWRVAALALAGAKRSLELATAALKQLAAEESRAAGELGRAMSVNDQTREGYIGVGGHAYKVESVWDEDTGETVHHVTPISVKVLKDSLDA